MADLSQLVRTCKALAAPTRVCIVHLLQGRALCVGALARRLGVTSGAASQHLRVLREAGLVVSERRGYYVHYRLNEEALARWNRGVGRLLEAGPQETSCCTRNRTDGKGATRCVTRSRAKAAANRKT